MPTWVQSQLDSFVADTGATTYNFSFLHPFTSGNALAGAAYVEQGGASLDLSSITDDAGNTYTILQTLVDVVSTNNFLVLFALAKVLGSPTTLTLTFSSAPSGADQYVWAEECSSVVSVDASVIGVNSTATVTPTSGNLTPTTPSDMILGFYAPATGSTPTAGSGFTIRTNDTTNGLFSETQSLSSAAAVAATFSQSTAGTGLVGAILLAPGTFDMSSMGVCVSA